MPSQFLLIKAVASLGVGVTVGGGSYIVYKNHDTIQEFFGFDKKEPTNNTTETSEATNLFVVRYKENKPGTSAAITADTSLTCSFGSVNNQQCKIYKFATSPRPENNFTASDIKSLTPATSTSDFAANTYFAIELNGLKKTATELQNKTFTLKQSNTTLGTFTFDQILLGEAGKETGKPDTRLEDSYVVKKSEGWTALTDPLTSYRCKLAGVTGKVDNYDSACKLVKLAPATSETITTLEQLKTLNTQLTADALKSDSDTYYKLLVNPKLLYNLQFTEGSEPEIQVELQKADSTQIGKVTIKQKIDANTVTGKADLLLAKVVNDTATVTGTWTGAKCNFEPSATINPNNQFECDLYKATKADDNSVKQLTLGTTKASLTETFTTGDHYLIKLTKEEKRVY